MRITDSSVANGNALYRIKAENKRALRWIVLIASPFVLIAAIMAIMSMVEYLEVRNTVKASVGEDQISAFGKMTEHGWSDRCISVEIKTADQAAGIWKAAHVLGAFEGGDWRFDHLHLNHKECWLHAAG